LVRSKRTAYGNNAKNDYTYDSLGRLDKVEHLNASSSVFDYVDLAYDPAGMITEKKRKDGASYFTTFYTYDDAYRLVEELTKNSSGVEKTVRTYGYDDAGNRTSMAFDNDSITTKSTTYSYGNRSQIVSNTGYYRDGTTDTGSMSYTWDEKGNMLTRTGSTYEWNEDNRLVQAYISGGDPKAELFQKFFKYDSAGRRILEYKNTDGIRKRFFFNGLTEEIKKVSVGTHADTSFARTVQLTSASGELSGWRNAHASHVSDADRFSTVTESYGEELAGTAYWETGTGWNIAGKHTFAIWAKASADSAWICICVKSTDNNYYGLVYQGTTGADYNTGNGGVIRVGGTAQDFTNGEWVRLERDLQADLTTRFGKTLSCVTGIYLWSGGLTTPKMWIDDLSFSNSLTVEHNTLGGGSIGHILRNRSTSASTYAATDRWFHYDQVGSVMAESDAAGTLAQTHYQDAFGNSQATWSTGLWGGDKPGWHHNTKAYDGDIGLVYMYQRWYNGETGAFVSADPFSPDYQDRFVFVRNSPVGKRDPVGWDIVGPDGPEGDVPYFPGITEPAILLCQLATIREWWSKTGAMAGGDDKVRHCIMSCLISDTCGSYLCDVAGNAKEFYDIVGPGDYSYSDIYSNQLGCDLGQDGCWNPEACEDKCNAAREGGDLPPLDDHPAGGPPQPW
jgi:RHS repeat-associated protein